MKHKILQKIKIRNYSDVILIESSRSAVMGVVMSDYIYGICKGYRWWNLRGVIRKTIETNLTQNEKK